MIHVNQYTLLTIWLDLYTAKLENDSSKLKLCKESYREALGVSSRDPHYLKQIQLMNRLSPGGLERRIKSIEERLADLRSRRSFQRAG